MVGTLWVILGEFFITLQNLHWRLLRKSKNKSAASTQRCVISLDLRWHESHLLENISFIGMLQELQKLDLSLVWNILGVMAIGDFLELEHPERVARLAVLPATRAHARAARGQSCHSEGTLTSQLAPSEAGVPPLLDQMFPISRPSPIVLARRWFGGGLIKCPS